jgi:competence protein ComEA
VWGALGLRVLAVGIALLGLAGIGSVVGRARSQPAASVSQAGLGLTALSSEAWAELALATAGGGAGARGPAPRELGAAGSARLGPGNSQSSPPPDRDAVVAAADAGSPQESAAAERAAIDEAARPPAPALPCSNGETGPKPSPAAASRAAPAAAGARVNLNLASAAELRALPGIGAKRAEAIVELRQRLGRFRRPADLLRIKGIGPRTLERLLPQVSVE